MFAIGMLKHRQSIIHANAKDPEVDNSDGFVEMGSVNKDDDTTKSRTSWFGLSSDKYEPEKSKTKDSGVIA